MKTYFKSLDVARNQSYQEIIHACYNMLKKSIDDKNDIHMWFDEIENVGNGKSEVCVLSTGTKKNLVSDAKPHFMIYNMLEHDVIRVMMQCCETVDGPAIVDFIVRHDEETGSINYEFAPIVQPIIDKNPTLMMPFSYMLGYIGGALKAFSEFSIHEKIDPTENGDDGTGGLNDGSKSN